MVTPGIFISYRREDSAGYAGRLFDILSAQAGRENTYMDLDTIEGGDDFTAIIEQKIQVSDVLIAVIGNRWLTVTDETGKRRLDNPGDFVRIEIGKALERGIRVIPVLVGGAKVPQPDDLPPDLKPLCERQAVEIRDSHFHPDCQQLLGQLRKSLHAPKSRLRRLAPAIVCLAGAILLASAILTFQRPNPIAGSQPKPPAVVPASTAQIPPPITAAPKDAAPQTPNINGKWTATVKYDWGDTYKEIYEFQVDDGDLSGMAGFLGDKDGDGRAILDGKVKGNHISFTTKTLSTTDKPDKFAEDKHYYKGTIDGETLKFTMTTDSSVTEHTPIHFVATRMKK